jgi:hypothetical protein
MWTEVLCPMPLVGVNLSNPVICYLLSVICYLLSVICYLLSVICYLLSVICYLGLVTPSSKLFPAVPFIFPLETSASLPHIAVSPKPNLVFNFWVDNLQR